MTSVRAILRSFRDRFTWSDGSANGVRLELGGRLISNPRLFRLTKTGYVSWTANLDGQPVKIYECHDEEQAAFIEDVSNHSQLKPYLPTCIMRINTYLLVEWIPGTPITREKISKDRAVLNQVTKLQALIHQQAIGYDLASGYFDYMDYLKNRLRRFIGIFPMDDALHDIYETLDDNVFCGEPRISHPDLTLDNLIVEEGTGALKIIDNESLTQNHYYTIDLFNTHKSLGEEIGSSLLEPYLVSYLKNGGDLTPLVQHAPFFDALWTLRVIGSHLQAGAFEKAFRLSQKFSERRTELHPLIQFVKTRFG